MKIVVHMVVSINSFSYSRNLDLNYIKLSALPENISFKFYCLDKWVYKLYSKKNNSNNVFLVDAKTQKGSFGHALRLKKCLDNLEKNAINIISDVDICIVKENWDESLKQILLEPVSLSWQTKNIGVLGTTYEDISGFSTGSSDIQTYKNRPTLTWCALSPNYDFKSLNVMPDKSNKTIIESNHLSDVYGLPIGFTLLKDVGWQLPLFLHESGIPYKVFDHVKPTDDRSMVLKGAYPYHDEFHLNGIPFLVHQRGSMKHVYRLDKISPDFYSRVSNYLKNPDWFLGASYIDYINFFYKKTRRILVKFKE